MKRTVFFSIATAIFAVAISAVSHAQTVKDASVKPSVDYTPLAVAIEKAGLVYQKTAPGTWVIPIPMTDENDKTDKDAKTKHINVIIIANSDTPIVTFNVLLAQLDKPISKEARDYIMDINNRYFMARFGYEMDTDKDTGKETGKGTAYARSDTLIGDITGSTVLTHINILKQIVLRETPNIMKVFPAPEKPQTPATPKGK